MFDLSCGQNIKRHDDESENSDDESEFVALS